MVTAASAPVKMHLAQVSALKNGRVSRVKEHMDRSRGLADAGLAADAG